MDVADVRHFGLMLPREGSLRGIGRSKARKAQRLAMRVWTIRQDRLLYCSFGCFDLLLGDTFSHLDDTLPPFGLGTIKCWLFLWGFNAARSLHPKRQAQKGKGNVGGVHCSRQGREKSLKGGKFVAVCVAMCPVHTCIIIHISHAHTHTHHT